MKYDILLFDADKTLFDFAKSERYALKKASMDLGISYKESYHLPIYMKINSALWNEFELGTITQDALKKERFSRFIQEIKETKDAAFFSASYLKHLADASFLLKGSLELIKELNPYYRMSIITNGLTCVQTKRVRSSILAPYFEQIIISEEINCSKPNPAIFDYTLHRMQSTNKEKVLMIGDSLTSDIKGGNNAGIDTCWYNPVHQKASGNTTITYEVSSFEQLKSLLL